MLTPTYDDEFRELLKLNEDRLSSDQNRSVAHYEEFFAPEFTASLSDYNIYDGCASART
jgi:hypothetical protein